MTDLYVLFYMVFHNKEYFIEASCLLASIKRFILCTVARVKCKNVHAVYLAASLRLFEIEV